MEVFKGVVYTLTAKSLKINILDKEYEHENSSLSSFILTPSSLTLFRTGQY